VRGEESLSLCMCVCVCVCVWLSVRDSECIFLSLSPSFPAYVCVCLTVSLMCVSHCLSLARAQVLPILSLSPSLPPYVCMYVCMCVCVCVHTHTHTSLGNQFINLHALLQSKNLTLPEEPSQLLKRTMSRVRHEVYK